MHIIIKRNDANVHSIHVECSSKYSEKMDGCNGWVDGWGQMQKALPQLTDSMSIL